MNQLKCQMTMDGITCLLPYLDKNLRPNVYLSKKISELTLEDINKDEIILDEKYLSKLKKIEEPIHPQINPNWNVIQPKCIMKIDYSHSPIQKKKINEFQGLGEEATFQIKMLFYSELGFDYRNRIAHGLINSDSFEQPYIWAFILKFLLDKADL